MINTQCIILIVGGREISRPHQNVGYRFEKFDVAFFQEIILSSGVFRRETASGFYPWGNVVSLRKKVAEGLCGRWHRQKDKNRSPSAKNQTSEIRLSENANKKRSECVMRGGIR